jgi:transposase
MSPEYVQPFVKAQKNDAGTRKRIAEAATRPTMRFVDLKSQEKLDMPTLHRARDRLVGERTALINQLRAILLERGIVVPRGPGKFEGLDTRWEAEAFRDQQARQQIPPKVAHPRRSLGDAIYRGGFLCRETDRNAASLGESCSPCP